MKVQTTLVGVTDHHRTLTWPAGWPVPRQGDTVELDDLPPLSVRRVVWYPEGDAYGDPEPSVYLVIGPEA